MYSISKQLESTKKEEIKTNCWFSWFRILLLNFSFNQIYQEDSNQICRLKNRLKDMNFVLFKKWYIESYY